ncbi:MAG: DUF1989 domain-containing protein [Rhizobiaceae bacterium]|nr:DUF1989 domain-containing protein [Rhizobiaceae bacterium]
MDLSPDARAAMDAHRSRYEALKAAGTGDVGHALPEPTVRGGASLDPEAIVSSKTVPGGWYTCLRLRRGEGLRLVNTTGASAVSLFAWNAADTSERLNHADSVKIQWSVTLRKGRVLFSDMGRVILSIVEDTSGAHDALLGGSTAASTLAAFGPGPFRNARDNAVQGALKLGLSKRDIGPCVTLFAPVHVGENERFVWREGVRKPGDFVDLRAEIDLLVLLSNTPHPLDTARPYAPGPVDVVRFRMPAAAIDDPCRTASAEARRGFENTAAALAV